MSYRQNIDQHCIESVNSTSVFYTSVMGNASKAVSNDIRQVLLTCSFSTVNNWWNCWASEPLSPAVQYLNSDFTIERSYRFNDIGDIFFSKYHIAQLYLLRLIFILTRSLIYSLSHLLTELLRYFLIHSLTYLLTHLRRCSNLQLIRMTCIKLLR